MKVILLAYTQLNSNIVPNFPLEILETWEDVTDGQIVSLAAIRQCYSHKTALEVLETESEKYFSDNAKEAKRLFNHINKSKHTSTMEHLNFTFVVMNVSRSLLAQLTRHRHMSFSVQSQRYVKFSSDSRSRGFDYVVPESIKKCEKKIAHDDGADYYVEMTPEEYFKDAIKSIQYTYDRLIKAGIPQEDARAVLPNAAACNLVLTANLRSLLEFYEKRRPGNGAQKEIAQLAEELKNCVIEVEPWTKEFFELTQSKKDDKKC